MSIPISIQPKILTYDDEIIIKIPKKILESLLMLSKDKERERSMVRSDIKRYRGSLKNKITIDPLDF